MTLGLSFVPEITPKIMESPSSGLPLGQSIFFWLIVFSMTNSDATVDSDPKQFENGQGD